MRYWV